MITSAAGTARHEAGRNGGGWDALNKQMRKCSKLVLSLVAAACCAEAGDVSAHTGAPPARATVIRGDGRGRLVRTTVVVEPKEIRHESPAATGIPDGPAKTPGVPRSIDEIVRKTAKEYNVDPLLVHAMIQVESNYNPRAISPAGAQGIMQLIPATARRMGVRNVFDAEDNIRGGVRYLRYLQEMFKDDRLAIAAYNAGENAVMRYSWIPPYPETQNYVYQVGKRYGQARKTLSAANKDNSAEAKQQIAAKPGNEEPPQPKEPVYRPVESYVDADGKFYLRTK